jgi:hypothetical protein
MSDEIVYQLTKTFFANVKDFHAVHASAREYDLEGSLESPTIPYHPGAIRYYKEAGRWNDAMAGLQSKLLK